MFACSSDVRSAYSDSSIIKIIILTGVVPRLEHGLRVLQGKGQRGHGPPAVVRLYDTLLANVKDLTEVANQLGGAAGEYLLDEVTAKASRRPHLSALCERVWVVPELKCSLEVSNQ